MSGADQRGGLMAWFQRSALWRLKVRLQFSGWLQYVATALVGAVLLALAALLATIDGLAGPLAWVLAALGGALALAAVFDVVTLKLGLRPVEAIPGALERLDAFELMRARRSCRSFQPRDLTRAHLEALLEAARLHCRAERRISAAPIRLEYVAAALTVWPVVGAREFFVAIAPREYDRGAVIDVGRSLQRVVLDATRLGVATCWIGPGADQTSVARQLGDRFDATRDHIICVCALGYRSRLMPLAIRIMNAAMHRRLPLTALLFADAGCTTPLATDTPPFSTFARAFEACRWSPSSYNEQPTRCVGVLDHDGQLARFDFYSATTSRYYAAVAAGIWLANWEVGCAALGVAGRFAALPSEQRGAASLCYDASWIVARPPAGDP